MQIQPLFLGLGTQEILLIGLIVLLFFGGQKIPEMMKGLGKGVRSFRDGIDGKDSPEDADKKQADNSRKDTPAD